MRPEAPPSLSEYMLAGEGQGGAADVVRLMGRVVRHRWCGRCGAADGQGGAADVVRLMGRVVRHR